MYFEKSDWENCKNNKSYGRNALDKCEFIHCSDVKDVVEVANSHFWGIKVQLLLIFAKKKLKNLKSNRIEHIVHYE
ncbi:MAG TPA: hypothetical protein DDW50_00240 [Firmicutes bacterium]|nr:hypothetical protein [Bacillota bacterium]